MRVSFLSYTVAGTACPNDHLIYFRFLGRVLGRALFDRQLVKGHMVRVLYKHLLGWPISFVDLQAQDETYYESLRRLSEMDDVSSSSLDFTLIEERMGVRDEVELVDGGALREVTNENLEEYMEANLRYRMLDRTKLQLTELLLGFFDVVPASALTVFDANELELILCGLPEIDMADWQAHTNYSGIYQDSGSDAQVVEWFWQVVEMDFDQEMKARLLQFVTGSSGVPSGGFSVLQGVDGNIKKFTIHGVDGGSFVLPRAHTCFNRIGTYLLVHLEILYPPSAHIGMLSLVDKIYPVTLPRRISTIDSRHPLQCAPLALATCKSVVALHMLNYFSLAYLYRYGVRLGLQHLY
jgi:hypothetical protein